MYKSMNRKIFVLEILVGICGFVLVMLFGVKGFAALALYAFVPLFRKKHIGVTETSDKCKFHKTNTITFAVSFLSIVLLFFLRKLEVSVNQPLIINDIWLYLYVFIILFVHGIVGLIIDKEQNSF